MQLTAGTKVGPYEIVAPLGAGGMGEVYRARDARLDREVALKVLPADFAAEADRLKRFEQEARATSALNHPNILTVYDIGNYAGAPFIVAELLEGEELRAQLDNGALPVRKAIEYAQQVAAGLAAAHEKGIVHRDLKPENLFVTKDGRVKILDFGLAKLKPQKFGGGVDSEAETLKPLTSPGVVMGTVGYMSPEQVRGHETDHRSDIFSFGMILYEMLSGKRAFSGASVADVMSAITRDEPPDLSETNAKVSPQLEKLVRHCLEKQPELRFQSARDLGFALEALSGSSGVSKPEAAVVSAPVMRRLSPLLIGLGLALLAVGAVAGMLVYRQVWQAPLPTYQQLTFRRGLVYHARFAPDGQTIVYSAAWSGKPLEIFSTHSGLSESRSLGLSNADLLAVSSTGELAVLLNRRYLGQLSSRGTLARIPLMGGAPREILEDVQEADWSPDGTNLAVVRYVGGRNRLEYPIGNVLYETAGYISYPRVSPQGDRVAFMDHQLQWDSRGWVAVVDLAGKKKVLTAESAAEEGLAWSPTGDEIWFTADTGEAFTLSAVTLAGQARVVARAPADLMLHDIARANEGHGRLLLTRLKQSTDVIGLPPGETKERDLSWLDQGGVGDLSADGKLFIFTYWGQGGGTNYTTYLRKTDGSSAVRLGEGDARALSPDGKWVLTIHYVPPQIVLLPTGAGETRRLERHGIEQYITANWFPDGKRVFFTGREAGRGMRCYVQEIETGKPRPITPEGVTVNRKLDGWISPDGRYVIARDAQQKRIIYPITEGEGAQPIAGLADEDEIARWSGDGRSLYVYQSRELPIRVYRLDLVTGRKALWKELMPADTAGIYWPPYILLTPDGKWYVYNVRRYLTDLYLVEGLK